MIRSFREEDKPALLELLRLNTPRYFDVSEEADFIEYLNSEIEDYFVVEENNVIIGAGGINYSWDKSEACFSWDFVHPDNQGKGVGKVLTIYRINHIKKKHALETIRVRTSQLAYKFYEKMGFQLEKIENDYWARNFHLYQMVMKL